MLKKSHLLLIVVALLAILGTMSSIALADSAPSPSCPAGYNLITVWGGNGEYLEKNVNRSTVNLGFSLAEASNVVLNVWSGVGHPELGCLAGENNDGGAYPGFCDDATQVNEAFYVIFNGVTLATVGDHGTDQWMAYGDVGLGQLGAGSYSVTLQHVWLGSEPFDSVFYDVGLCTQVVPQDDGWDKSSLYFNGPTMVDNGVASAWICNGGSSMTGTTSWELFYSDKGNAKNGSVIANGTVNALASGECQLLSWDVSGYSGNFKFKAYQRTGHPGKGELWSD